MKKWKKIVLLSGGTDSATALASELAGGSEVSCLGFDYGAKHNEKELTAARMLADHYGVPFRRIPFRLPPDWGSSLIDPRLNVMSGDATVVPARNALLISYAAGIAQREGFEVVVVGCNATDRGTYPDCRRSFLLPLSIALEAAYDVRVEASFVDLDKSEVIRLGQELGVPWHLTWSCYVGGDEPCGICGACWIRRQAFAQVGLDEERLIRLVIADTTK